MIDHNCFKKGWKILPLNHKEIEKEEKEKYYQKQLKEKSKKFLERKCR